MTITQSAASKAGLALTAIEDSDGYYYFPFGPVRLYFIQGDTANTIITAPIGSLAIRTDTLAYYLNSNAGTTWTTITSA